ncbi:MAG: type I glyceraldehyde-3-phosphate dehydrogenase [Betaproteobacteria bacterium]|nr:type I glyceraldehyde-3-phosphate dehydrogenase [Betaproteobacteria bacterium]
MKIKAGINGFGRIGRCVFRAASEGGLGGVEIAAINSRSDSAVAAHLLQYDGTHGRFGKEVKAGGGFLETGGRKIRYTQETSPENINWQESEVDIILECSGVFNARESAARHLSAGAKKVLVSAPCKNADATVVYGVNHNILAEKNFTVVSAASCTTNCLAPLLRVLHENFGVVQGWMTTVHAMTADQRLLDESHKDLRRARAAGFNIIPTKTGAADAIGLVIPELAGKIGGGALRVPVANVSLVDLTCLLEKQFSAAALNTAFTAAAKTFPSGVLAVDESPLVSSDYNHSIYSAVVDAGQTRAAGGLAKVFAWYDNEWGFANRMLDVAAAMVAPG